MSISSTTTNFYFSSTKDLSDVCFQHKNLLVEEYYAHIERKNLARQKKETAKEIILNEHYRMITIIVQNVKLTPQILASTLYYKQKLYCHNFNVYNLVNKQTPGYWFHKCFIFGRLLTATISNTKKTKSLSHSDEGTSQNRNNILANALLYLSDK